MQTRRAICGACERTLEARERLKKRRLRGEKFNEYTDTRYRRE